MKSSVIEGAKTAFNNSKIGQDIKNFDLKNTSANAVMDANFVSAYKGALAIKAPLIGRSAFSCGIMVIGEKVTNFNTIKHEYGHIIQFNELGVENYLKYVFVPSVTFLSITIK